MRRSSGVIVVGALIVAGAFEQSGCSSGSSGESTGTTCHPGDQIACSCTGTDFGVQICRSDGSGYEPCVCKTNTDGGNGGAGGSGGGTDAGTEGG
jgi:hypothetical protein